MSRKIRHSCDYFSAATACGIPEYKTITRAVSCRKVTPILTSEKGYRMNRNIIMAIKGIVVFYAAWFQSTAFALPEDKAISLQEAASPIAEEVHVFHNWVLMPIMTGISLFVLGLLAYVIFRFNAKANPVPNRFSHNTLVEVVWTVVPIIILLFIALFSFDLLYKEDRMPDGKQAIFANAGGQSEFAFENKFNPRRNIKKRKHIDVYLQEGQTGRKLRRSEYEVAGLGKETVTVTLNDPAPSNSRVVIRGGRTRVGPDKVFGVFGENRSEIALAPTVTVKAIGRQWGWDYQYPGMGDFELISNLLPREETTAELYLYATTSDVVVPVGETVRLITTATDVIHSWAMPAFAVKVDAVPGRNNETWFKANRTGMYYGQCSEICGKDHAFMPISVKVVTRPEYEAWIDSQRQLAGLEPMFNSEANIKLAQASAE